MFIKGYELIGEKPRKPLPKTERIRQSIYQSECFS